jgi:putative chitinase
MIITFEQLNSLFPNTNSNIITNFIDPFNTVIEKYEINNTNRISMFMAQVGHESGGLSVIEENLHYRADRLSVVFPSHFVDVNTANYANKPEKIANRVYANRMGNGDEDSGDGYNFRGRGLIQLTGRDNYNNFANDMSMTIDSAVTYLETPEGAAMSAAWFWDKHGLNDFADAGDILSVTKRINGGTNGLQDRTNLYQLALTIFV